MEQGLEAAVAEVRGAISAGSAKSALALIHFADRFAVTSRLRNAALVLKLNHARAYTDSQRADLRRQMEALVDQVVADHESLAYAAETLERAQTQGAALAKLKERAPVRPLAFSCEGLKKTYPRSDFTLDSVSLELRQGEVTAVVGQNAHGKTTLLRMVAGDLRHDEGSLSYPGHPVRGDGRIDWVSVKSSLAYLPQELPSWPGSLRDNLHYEAAIHGVRGEVNEREVSYVVERLELGDYLGMRWQELSGGYKLRFSLARALVWKPRLLVMDEPLANLDAKAKTSLLKDVRDLADSLKHPMAVIMSSQDLHELEAVSDAIVFLREGRVIYSGPMERVGIARDCNAFELGVDASLSELRQHFEGSQFVSLKDDGVSLVLTTRREVTHRQVLEKLMSAGVEIRYFRDISRSTRQLFE